MRTYALLAVACAALAGLAETDETARVTRLRDEVRRFNAAAARLAVEDLARDAFYDAIRHRAAVDAWNGSLWRTWLSLREHPAIARSC